MSKTVQKGYINKKEKGSGDYEEFTLEGIEILQKLSSANWTDYNEHDPGVTILENIAYTLTDLSNKTNLPIQDILTESKGSDLLSGDNAFFTPSEILTTNPITPEDFRKLIIDAISNVKNVWVVPENSLEVNPKNERNQINGLYNIWVELFEYDKDENAIQKEKQRVTDAIKKLFHESRNLCEDLLSITIKDPLYLQMKLHLTINDSVNGEKIMAKIYFQINRYLAREVPFYSLWELKSKGKSTNEIFNGPDLKNGFIPKEKLPKLRSGVDPIELIKLIGKIKGVLSVDDFALKFTNPLDNKPITITTKPVQIPKHTTPFLVIPETTDDLLFVNDGVTFKPDPIELNNHFSYKVAKNYGSFKAVSQAMNTIEIPKGKNLGILSYYPLREQFPAVYGIGRYGLPKRLPSLRYAQANQLKAYLLPLDQLMKNFLAQLTHIYTLYDVKGDNTRSFFYDELEDMESLTELIKDTNTEHEVETLEKWKSTLDALNTTYDTEAMDRLHSSTDNLMARFCEVFPSYILKKINSNAYGKQQTNIEFDKDLLLYKRKFLSNYATLSYNRAKGYDYTKLGVDTENNSNLAAEIVPSIVQKVSILLGIENFELRFLSKEILDSGLRVFPKKEAFESLSETLEVVYTKDDVEVIDLEESITVDKTAENLRDAFYFVGHSETIFNDVLKNGVLEENYTVEKNEKKGDTVYVKYTTNKRDQSVVHIANSELEAQKAIMNTIAHLSNISKRTEGLYLVEHLLLAPPFKGSHFGFRFEIHINNTTAYFFEHNKLKPLADRNNCINQLQNGFNTNKLSFCTIEKEKAYAIQISAGKNSKPLAVSKNRFTEASLAEKEITYIKDALANKCSTKQLRKFRCLAYFGNKKVKEDFFSFKMSFVLPAWPARFQQNSFRTKFDTILFEHAPVHIACHSYWLDLPVMAEFEKHFNDWRRTSLNDPRRLDLAYQLIKVLKQCHKKNHN
jgi:hypothetical protein